MTTERLTITAASDDEMRALIAAEESEEMRQAYGEMLAGCLAFPQQRQWYAAWFIFLDGQRIGDLCFKGLSPEGCVEIGYGLLPEYWGKGYATEAVRALTAWASCQPGVTRIEAETEPDNTASQRVLEKAGFVPTGTMGAEGPRFVWNGAVRLEKIAAGNVWQILRLHVSPEQENFVAPNDISIIEAYLAVSGGGHALPFGIFAGDVPVGFLMIGYDVDASYENPPRIAYGNYSIWRLMIDKAHQHRGYGKQALARALDFIRTRPCGPAEYCYLSYEPENTAARSLYHQFGFTENGEYDGNEVVAVLKM